MYDDILFPLHFASTYTDTFAPTTFANTDVGILGLEIFFEARPWGYESVVDQSMNGETIVMAAISVNAINRSMTNNIDIEVYPSDPPLLMAAKDQSPSIWNVNKSGTGGLKSTPSSLLASVLSGAVHTQNCNGLMYSWAMAVASRNQYVGNAYPPAGPAASATNYFRGTLFFNTDGSTPSVLKSRQQYLQPLGFQNAPKYPSGYNTWHFWSMTDATTYGNFPVYGLLF